MTTPNDPLSFCKATGWPYDEWMQLTVEESGEILALYGLDHSPEIKALSRGYSAGYSQALDDVLSLL